MMANRSRILIAVASIALGLMFVLPVWTIRLEAPQYPEGLGMVIKINTIEGGKPHDLDNINNLNHYIGMRRIVPESIPELRIMPFVVATLVLGGLVVVALGRRRWLYLWTASLVVISAAGMADFWKWAYDYGHDLDEEIAIIKIPGMSYQPPIIGSRQILNFKAHSWPGPGGAGAILATLIAVTVAISERRSSRRTGGSPDRAKAGSGTLRPLTTAVLVLLTLSACNDAGPRPLIAGVDRCADCLMVVDANGHGAQIVTKTGRIDTFDSLECMISHVLELERRPGSDGEIVRSAWVTDFANPETLVEAERAFYLVSAALASPMGLGITAFEREEDRDAARRMHGGEPVDWREVRAVVAAGWPDGRPSATHGGHTSTAPVPGAQVAGGSREFATIGAAVAAAASGDTVHVPAGTHREPTITIDKPLSLIGVPGAILDGEGERGLIRITADSVSVVGLTLRNTGTSVTEDRAAILVDKARYCEIRDNRLEDAFFGIYLANAGACRVEGNVLVGPAERETRSGNGIHLWYSTGITLMGNRVTGHRDGIYFEFVEKSDVSGNYSTGNVRYGLHFMFSDGCTYRGNRFTDNGAGVAVMYTRDVVMDGNDFRGSLGTAAFGLLLKDITDSDIRNNRFRRNSVAVHADGVNRVTVRGNDFIENGWALQIMANSERSVVSGNNFVGNSFDVATNSRRSYSEFDGNYWDRYRGFDRDADGVGDIAFHPVRLFSLVVAQNEPALVLQRSPLVMLLDAAEQVLPLLTPENLTDARPVVGPLRTRWST